jgi:hypothetical protein
LSKEFRWSPCHVKSSLVRFMSTKLTCCISFSSLRSFLLKTCVS